MLNLILDDSQVSGPITTNSTLFREVAILTEEFDARLLERPGLLQTIQRNSYDLFAKGKKPGPFQ